MAPVPKTPIRGVALAAALAALSCARSPAQETGGPLSAPGIVPAFSIWDVPLGEPVAALDHRKVAEVACGTRGGPASLVLATFGDWAECPPEPSGLREIAIVYDDERDYIARALELEYQVLRGGTSVYAQPVIVSVLVDGEGLAQGLRVVTDDRVSDHDRRNAVTLARNFKARFRDWALDCRDLPPREGEQPAGNQFIHELCTGTSPEGLRALVEATYLRKRGQEGLNRETGQVNTGYFESRTYVEILRPPYAPEGMP